MNLPQRNIAIVAGGESSEWVVSMKSAQGLAQFLNNPRYRLYTVIMRCGEWYVETDGIKHGIDKNDFSVMLPLGKVTFDFAWITIHGTPGEDGILQGYFDLLHIPYSCCGTLAASLTFNKYFCSRYLKGFGVQVSPSMLIDSDTFSPQELVDAVGLPCFVKPNAGGSSFGTTKVKRVEDVVPAVRAALNEGSVALVESFIAGVEITCGCYKVKGKEVVFPITEVVSKNEFFDFESKYVASKVEEITPARLDLNLTRQIQNLTLKIYDWVGAKGIIRVDYIVRDNLPVLLEVNTTPGMTLTSFIPQQVRAAGLNITEVMTEIVENEF